MTDEMTSRLRDLPDLGVDTAAAAAGDAADVLRLENLDTDLRPPQAALDATHASIEDDDANSYLPFTGSRRLRELVASQLERQTGRPYDPETEVVITCGATEGMLDALLATAGPGDEVIVTDPTYVGMVARVRMTGARPVGVPFRPRAGQEWRLDVDALRAAVTPRTRALFVMSPSMPSGAALTEPEWHAVGEACERADVPLIYDAAMERILFDGRAVVHPATLPGLRERTLTIGSISKERRMIGWRVGWVAGPAALMRDVIRCHLFNVVTPVGIAQAGACAAVAAPESDIDDAVAEWERRRDVVVRELEGYAVIPAAGGWSMLLDATPLGMPAAGAAELLLQRGRVAATPMDGWGEVNGPQYLRLVFSNEPAARLAELGERFAATFG